MTRVVAGMLLLGALAVAGTAGASHGQGAEPFDYARGAGTASVTHVAFSARSEPGGGEPSGSLTLGSWHGSVHCLVVEGNRAFMLAIRVVRDGRFVRGEDRWLLVEDGGEGAPDLVAFGAPIPRFGIGTECVMPEESPPAEVLEGTAVVPDAAT